MPIEEAKNFNWRRRTVQLRNCEEESIIENLSHVKEELEENPKALIDFSEEIFRAIIEKIIVEEDGTVSYRLKGGIKLNERHNGGYIRMKIRNIPFGYEVVGGRYVVNNGEAEIISSIYSMYLSGKTLLGIAEALTEQEVTYFEDTKVWNKNMVSRILADERYLGNETFPRLVDSNNFNLAKNIRAEKGGKKAVLTPLMATVKDMLARVIFPAINRIYVIAIHAAVDIYVAIAFAVREINPHAVRDYFRIGGYFHIRISR